MKCLWLTLADPNPPHNGQYVYSGGLIDAFAAAGAEVTVLGLSRPESTRRDGERADGILWRLAEHRPLSHWSSLVSPLPNVANRCRTPAMREMLDELLWRGAWDVVIFDGLSAGWALRRVLRRYADRRGRPRLVYVSHNHEASLRAGLAVNQTNFFKRQVMRVDAGKIALLERALVDAVDLVTAITPEDGALYRCGWPLRKVAVLTPGYRGRHISARKITGELPRRAIIVGSFDWVAKRMNLEEFVRAADPIFAARGIELQVVGSGNAAFFDHMRRHVAATRFTGPVESVGEFLDGARVAIVPERSGGGFKLKVLEYVFNRMPIVALHGSIAGVPLRQEESVLLYSSQETLAAGIAQVIDDVPRLNRMQDAAFVACRGAFDWASRGRQLVGAVGSL